MNTDIRIACDCPDHPKIEKLCRRLGNNAFRCLIRFWCFVAVNHPSGELQGMDSEDIEIAAGWRDEPGALLKALLEVKLIVNSEQGYRVHEWEFHQAYVIGAPERKIRATKGNVASQVKRGIMTQEEADKYLERKVKVIKSATSALQAQLDSACSTASSVAPPPAPPPAPVPTKTNLAPVGAGTPKKANGKVPKPPIESRQAKSPTAKLVKYWHVRFEEIHGVKYTGDIVKMQSQAKKLLSRNELGPLVCAINYLLTEKENGQYSPHTFDHFVHRSSLYMVEAKEFGYTEFEEAHP